MRTVIIGRIIPILILESDSSIPSSSPLFNTPSYGMTVCSYR